MTWFLDHFCVHLGLEFWLVHSLFNGTYEPDAPDEGQQGELRGTDNNESTRPLEW